MAHRGRCFASAGHAQKGAVTSRTRKRSLGCRAEAREHVPQDGGASPATQELARLFRLKNVDESMRRLAEVMERSTGLFRNSPDFAIPEIRFSQIEDGRFPYYVTRQVNRRGVLVVREAVPVDTVLRWRDDLMEYLEVNGLNDGTPGVKDIFWSKVQAQAREHQGVGEVLSALNRLWKPDALSPVDLTKSLSYCDRAFVGKPTSSSLLAEDVAVMAGGPWASQRWLNPHHREAYREIFDGRWEDWDPFKAGPRLRAAESPAWGGGGDAFGGTEAPQAFRPFQGYLSFGRWGELGNVHVVPMMRVSTAYMLLRPFMSDMLSVDAADEDWLCGAGNGPELALSPKWHQPILDALVRLPPLSPGDAVFWHTDIVHCEAGAIPRAVVEAERAAVAAVADSRKATKAALTERTSPASSAAGGGRGDADGPAVGEGVGDGVKGEAGGRSPTGSGEGLDGRRDCSPASFAGVQLSSLPICNANAKYLKAQATAFVEGTRPPGVLSKALRLRDGLDGVVGEEKRKIDKGREGRFVGRVTTEDMTRGGEQAMGLRSFRKEHSNAALEEHHRLLGLPYEW